MPPHLHPRSTATSTLFAGTLLASFVVVAIPHLVPCPRPRGRGQFDSEVQLDENGKPVHRIKKKTQKSDIEQHNDHVRTTSDDLQLSKKSLQDEAVMFRQLQEEARMLKADSQDRECPVPKPREIVGKWLGFEDGRGSGSVRATSKD